MQSEITLNFQQIFQLFCEDKASLGIFVDLVFLQKAFTFITNMEIEEREFWSEIWNSFLLFRIIQMAINYMTKEGYDKLLEEIVYLESEERSSIIKQITEAREKGDLSENVEYDAAREAQSILESRIIQLKSLAANTRLIDESRIRTDSVQILNKVTLRNIKNDQTIVYTLVSEAETDLKAGKISIDTPVGKGLIGKKIGEIAEIKTPSGIIYFEILNISI